MKIIKKYKVFNGDFSNLFITEFEDKLGNLKKWEFIERSKDTRVVVINAFHKDKIVLVKQFRFPINMYSIEFPAGLIDDGETPESTAVRELLEETGYKGIVTNVSPPLCTSAGITGEIVYLIDMDITSEKKHQTLDESEEIEVLEFSRESIKSELTEYLKAHPDCSLDSKVWATYFEK
ncbi:MAG: NUDIX hydrolase [Candidatus Delongbacteria bacterium]|nr:NUDIX hydrolase [Candidatus Delongbacteria bacterium]MCG2760211.1 NUDIX hydrolase [Candidatus Delongbacteria bacterium]